MTSKSRAMITQNLEDTQVRTARDMRYWDLRKAGVRGWRYRC